MMIMIEDMRINRSNSRHADKVVVVEYNKKLETKDNTRMTTTMTLSRVITRDKLLINSMMIIMITEELINGMTWCKSRRSKNRNRCRNSTIMKTIIRRNITTHQTEG